MIQSEVFQERSFSDAAHRPQGTRVFLRALGTTTRSFLVQMPIKTFLAARIVITFSAKILGSAASACCHEKLGCNSDTWSKNFKNLLTSGASSSVKLCPTNARISFIS